MKRKIFTLALAVLFCSPLANAATYENPIKTTFDDGVYLAASPLRLTSKDLPIVLGIAGGVGGAALLDRTVRHHLFPWRNSSSAKSLRSFGDVGEVSGPIIGTIFAVQGWAAKNEKSKDTAFLCYESFVLAGAAEVVVKFAVGRKRPSATDDPFHFKPGGSDASFPSGHTTEAFAAATVLAEQYPHWQTAVPAYAAAAAVGYSRLAANQHWLSDVLGGAVLGTVVSHALHARHRSGQEASWDIQSDGKSVRLVKKF